MKREEQVASEFLTTRFGKKPVYEPLGKSTPPDFSIDDTAFEVRRLNQRYINDSATKEVLSRSIFLLTSHYTENSPKFLSPTKAAPSSGDRSSSDPWMAK
jgi:hypothetical protein